MSKRLLTFIVLAVALIGGGIWFYRAHTADKDPTPITSICMKMSSA